MTELLLYIQKNVYRISLAAGIFLGFAAAFFLSVLISVFWQGNGNAGAVLPVKSRAPVSGRPFQPKETFYSFVTGNLFRERSASQEAAEEAPEEKLGEFILVGVLAGDRSWARAAVQIEGEQDANEYKIGQTVVGYVIHAIYADSVRVKRGPVSLLVKVGEKTSELRAKLALPPETAQNGTASGESGEPPSSKDATKITLSRDKLLALTRDQSELYKNKFTPFMRGDKILGLQFILVPDNNFLYELGLRSGDILRRINGQPMENTQRMIEFYQSLSTASRITVDIERAGKILPYEILIQ